MLIYVKEERERSRRGLGEVLAEAKQLQEEGLLPQIPGKKGFVSQRGPKYGH